ncbi:MAG: succinylglutamate desuccinylase/aspartoacylase family protein [Atopobiaceae bacterium]|nr:succinylglutamate desuccinylase/aspartoacylase family protein [Atopobiaceae bacterium]
MIKTIFSAALPVSERLVIRKNRIVGAGGDGPRLALVTGIHGDELEGQYVAFELARRLGERLDDLAGTVDIYPAINPLGLSSHEHGAPGFDIDLDRTFPGSVNGNLTDALAHAVFSDVMGADVCIDVRSTSSYLQEVTQVRIDEQDAGKLVRIASALNARLVWVRVPTAVLDSTLAHCLNASGVPTLEVQMGSGMRISQDAGTWLVEGLLNLLEHLGAWTGPTIQLPPPMVSTGKNVATLVAESPGIFVPKVECGCRIRPGQVMGIVADPLEGVIKQEIASPCEGMLFALRTYPMVYPGSLLARVLRGGR